MKVIAWPAFKTRYKNPYNWLLYSQMGQQGVTVEEFSPLKLLRQHYDIFHLHWAAETIVRHPNPTLAFIRAKAMLALIDRVRHKGTRIIWTFHDKIPHIVLHPQIADWFQSEFVSRVDAYISMCEAGKTLAEETFPSLKQRLNSVVPHGHYRGEYPNQVDKISARKTLDIPEKARTIVFLGHISPYKNVPHLIRTFCELDDADLVLVVAGTPDLPELKTEVFEAADGDFRVRLSMQYVPPENVQFYLKSADLVVLPFQEILNSGSAILALSLDCPILVPRKGALGELQALVGEAWVKTYSDELTSDILREGLDWAVHTPRPEQAPLEMLDWSVLSKKTIQLYRAVCQ